MACSDFKKSKSMSYGSSFEAYQEYCTDEAKMGGTSNEKNRKNNDDKIIRKDVVIENRIL
ncbi:hypothetical protein N8368_00910 [Bacteroidia bacterium]|nr:hypothetical protein [Bacteroidia bacterium]MDC1395048.1 hypothetical protein [Bacteroidia bacterium]